MEVRLGSTEGSQIASPSESIEHFAEQTRFRQIQWAERLADVPDAFAEIEQEIDRHFRQGAGQLTAALLAEVTVQPTMNEQFDQVRQQATQPLKSPEPRRLRVRLLCGLMLFITTAYCAPRRKKQNDSQERQAGLYPELAALGFGKGCSPALQYTVARIVALSPSIALARKELARQGLDWIERRAGLDPSRTVHVLDFCHAAHHISLALKALGLAETQRHETYRRLRKLLKRSRYDQVVEQLERLSRHQPEDGDVWTEIRYLENHGQAGHLNYATFRRRGIPCGSGAIESVIRRVINQRLKSNAMYWLQENAEAMFAVRATLLCDRWEETLKRVRHTMSHDRRLHWRWDAPDTSSNLNANLDVQPPQPQHFTTQQPTTVAA